MDSLDRFASGRGGRARRSRPLAAVATALMVVACQSSATPSVSSTASEPGPSVAATGAPPSSSPPPSQTPPPPSVAAAAHWVAAGSTSVWRRAPQAIALSGGRVLLIGAVEPDSGDIQTTAELWDPATNAWTATDGLPKARTDFVAAALGDDRVLVAGGLNADQPQSSYSSAYIYDGRPGQGTWTKTGLMGAGRTGPSSAVLADGRVLVAGGYFFVSPTGSIDGGPAAALALYHPGFYDVDPGTSGAALATAELFDPKTGTWSPTGPLRYARYGAPAVTLADGRVLVVSSSSSSDQGFGILVDGHSFETSELYDPATGRFSLAGSLPKVDRAALKAQATKGANPMPADDGELNGPGTLVALKDGGAVLIAQSHSWKHVGEMTRSFRFDGKANTWSEIGQTYVFVGEPTAVPLWTPGVPEIGGAGVATLLDGRVLVAGGSGPNKFGDTGFDETATVATVQLYDPATNGWSNGPAAPEPRSGGATVVLSDGSVLVADGIVETTDGVNQLTSAARYVP